MDIAQYLPGEGGLVVVGRIIGFEPTAIFRKDIIVTAMKDLKLQDCYVGPDHEWTNAYRRYHGQRQAVPLPSPTGWFCICRVPVVKQEKYPHSKDAISRAMLAVRDFSHEYEPEKGQKSPTLIKWTEKGREIKHAEGIELTGPLCEKMAMNDKKFTVKIEPVGTITGQGFFEEIREFRIPEEGNEIEMP